MKTKAGDNTVKASLGLILAMFLPLPGMANCIPPWQVQFACHIPARDARAEFCRLADPADHPGLKEAYYSYAAGTNPAELYFQTDSIWFSTKDTDIDHPFDLTMALGYARGDYIYAFVVTEDSRAPGGIREAEVRVYGSAESFTSETRHTELVRLHCDPATILADRDSIRP